MIFGAIYLVGDALVHLFDLRLTDVAGKWDQPAIIFSRFMSILYASFVLAVALVVFELQKDLAKYQQLIKLSAIWALFHGLLLLYLSFQYNFPEKFQNTPSIYLDLPFYNYYLLFEASLLFSFSLVVFWYFKTPPSKK